MYKASSKVLKKYEITKEKLYAIADAYIWGIYTYQQMSELFKIPVGTMEKILKDKKLFEELLNLDTFNMIQEKTKLILKISGNTSKIEFIINHECRKLINQDVYVVSPYIKKVIGLVNDFIKYNGNSETMAKNTGKSTLEVNASLHCNELKNYLLPEVYSKFQIALELDDMFVNRNLLLMREYFDKVFYLKYLIDFSNQTVANLLGISIHFIDRLLNDPYAKVRELQLESNTLSKDEIMIMKINIIADHIIEKNLSLREAENIFKLSYSTIYNYISKKDYLPEEKYNIIKEMLIKRKGKTVENTDYLKEIKQLYDDNFSISQIAKCVNKDKTTVYRMLKKYYPETYSTQQSAQNKNLTK